MVNVRNCGIALGTVAAIFYVACVVLVAAAPAAYVWLFNSWVHGVNLQSLYDPMKIHDKGTVLAGLVTFTIFGWVTGILYAAIYNKLACRAVGP